MFINKDSIIIDGVSFGQYLTSVEYQYAKLWGDDTGRNLAGRFSGTLLRIAPKIILNFHRLTTEDLRTISPILNKKYQSFTYNDPELGIKTITTYTGDWSIVYKGFENSSGFKVSFIDTGTR